MNFIAPLAVLAVLFAGPSRADGLGDIVHAIVHFKDRHAERQPPPPPPPLKLQLSADELAALRKVADHVYRTQRSPSQTDGKVELSLRKRSLFYPHYTFSIVGKIKGKPEPVSSGAGFISGAPPQEEGDPPFKLKRILLARDAHSPSGMGANEGFGDTVAIDKDGEIEPTISASWSGGPFGCALSSAEGQEILRDDLKVWLQFAETIDR